MVATLGKCGVNVGEKWPKVEVAVKALPPLAELLAPPEAQQDSQQEEQTTSQTVEGQTGGQRNPDVSEAKEDAQPSSEPFQRKAKQDEDAGAPAPLQPTVPTEPGDAGKGVNSETKPALSVSEDDAAEDGRNQQPLTPETEKMYMQALEEDLFGEAQEPPPVVVVLDEQKPVRSG